MSQVTKNNQFLQDSLEQVPRLLGQLNRNPSSRSYGSFDRAYWHYRTNDISSCRYQEAVYTLALLYCAPFKGNVYYRDEQVLKWIRASLAFTVSLQRSNGSFDEWYVHEGSYVATAFLTTALGETIELLMKHDVHVKEEAKILTMLEKAAEFLMQQEENTVMNQVSGAIAALSLSGQLCNRKDLVVYADGLLDKFVSKQDVEGWWNEYGGPDIGYLSLTIHYLERYHRVSGSKKVFSSLEKAKAFVELFIHPDGTAGGEYLSRNTEYIIPSTTLPYLGAVRPEHLDDRYLCYILYNWVEAGLQVSPQPIPHIQNTKQFSSSSLLRTANEHYFLVAGGKKGGSFRLYAAGKVYYDSGLEIAAAGTKLSTGILDHANMAVFSKNQLRVVGVAKIIKEPLLRTAISVCFKSWQLILGRFSFLQRMLKHFLRSQMISYSTGSGISFERTIVWHANSVVVTDTVRGDVSRDDIVVGSKAAYSAVPSSKYAAVPEIANRLLTPDVVKSEARGAFVIKRTFVFDE